MEEDSINHYDHKLTDEGCLIAQCGIDTEKCILEIRKKYRLVYVQEILKIWKKIHSHR